MTATTISQTFSKENTYENVIISYNLTYLNFTESARIIINDQLKLWPESKQDYLNTLFEELQLQKNLHTSCLPKYTNCLPSLSKIKRLIYGSLHQVYCVQLDRYLVTRKSWYQKNEIIISKEYWTKTKWCMKYYNLEPIKDTTPVTNPPLQNK
ncbi:uncharacterized protein LOC132941771 [Metopolophium dirhodum]|uniref:uncharacterized protein LOC132941771 n=1 Tax=Metopolophium dirhodum TaxID=44670 RepID=UPI00298F799A|nr:uncharacterized protein LOC132941771 [Metopolophium dirhodum]